MSVILSADGQQASGSSVLIGLLAAGVMWLVSIGLTKRSLAETASNLELLVVSGAVALAGAIVQGVVLHSIGSLNATGWLVSVGISALAAALYLGRSGNPFTVISSRWVTLRPRDAFILAAAAYLSFLAVQRARDGALSHRQFAFTEFWLLQDGDRNSKQFVLGFMNHEREIVDYAVDVLVDGRLVDVWSGIEVGPGKSWVTTLSLPRGIGPNGRVEGLLYKNDDRETAYRRVWVDGTP